MVGRPIRVMVVGIPNVGKSSFINRMISGGKAGKAEVQDRPGVTSRTASFPLKSKTGKGINLGFILPCGGLEERIQHGSEKGMVGRPIPAVMVVGIPNVSKSASFIQPHDFRW